MTTETLLIRITAGRIEDAVALALEHPVRWVMGQFSYDDLDAEAEVVSEFLQRWLAALSPFERLEAADWAAGQYVTAMVHLEHAYGIAARLLLDAQRGAASALADSMRDFWPLTDGPDAKASPEVAERLSSQAETLDRMTF